MVKPSAPSRSCGRVLVFIVSAFLLSGQSGGGCSDTARPVVSIEEAKRVTASFAGQSFVPPPRTIADITAILDQEKPDLQKLNALRSAADQPPPSGMSDRQLATFFYDRGMANRVLGRSQAMTDFARAAELAMPIDQQFAAQSLGRLANEQALNGLAKPAIDTAERVLKLSSTSSHRFYALARLVEENSRLGNFAAAEGHLAGMQTELHRQVTFPWTLDRETVLHGATARMLRAKGDYSGAATSMRAAVAASGRLMQNYSSSMQQIVPFEAIAAGHNIARSVVSDMLSRSGHAVEGEVEGRKAIVDSVRSNGRFSSATGLVLLNTLGSLREQGRHAEEAQFARAAIEILSTIGYDPNDSFLIVAKSFLASALAAQGRWDETAPIFAELRPTLDNPNSPFRRFVVENLLFVPGLIERKQWDSARTLVQAAIDTNSRYLGERHYETAEARGFAGLLAAKRGETTAALDAFQAAIPILLSASRQSGDEMSVTRELKLKLILDSYIGLLAELKGRSPAGPDPAAESFRLADAARGQVVQRSLSLSAARASVRDPALADLARREQDARQQIGALNGLLANIAALPPGQQDEANIRQLRQRIDGLRDSRAVLREEIERRFPDYAGLIDPRPATVEQVRAALGVDEALVAFYIGENQTYVWAVPKQGPIAFANVALPASALSAEVKQLWRALDPQATTLGDIPPFDVARAHALYAKLLRPVEAGWKNAKSLLVVPHGALGQLPLALLPTRPVVLQPRAGEALFAEYKRVPWLINDVAITQLPSVASLATLRSLPPGNPSRKPFVGFGDPWFSEDQARLAANESPAPTRVAAADSVANRSRIIARRSTPATAGLNSAGLAQLPRLPETADELRRVAVSLNADPAADVYTGVRANEQTVRSIDLASRQVVMFATHGLVPGDLDGLTQPALALTAPKVAGIDGDGLLTMEKILGLKLDADWVVLSACNTAAGDGAGAEAVSGLGRAFFYAGARALLVSNWPVETTSASALTTDLFRRQAGDGRLSRAQALRAAMLGLIGGDGRVESGQTVYSYAHPIFWAPFSLVGDGGGGRPGT